MDENRFDFPETPKTGDQFSRIEHQPEVRHLSLVGLPRKFARSFILY